MRPSFLFGVVYKKIRVLNLNAGHVTSSPFFDFHLAMFATEKCVLVSFIGLLSLSSSSCPSLLSMAFLESRVFVKRVCLAMQTTSLFLVIGLVFFFHLFNFTFHNNIKQPLG